MKRENLHFSPRNHLLFSRFESSFRMAPSILSLQGHTADVLDLSWSKNYFVLSSGMDRTVKLWHLSR